MVGSLPLAEEPMPSHPISKLADHRIGGVSMHKAFECAAIELLLDPVASSQVFSMKRGSAAVLVDAPSVP